MLNPAHNQWAALRSTYAQVFSSQGCVSHSQTNAPQTRTLSFTQSAHIVLFRRADLKAALVKLDRAREHKLALSQKRGAVTKCGTLANTLTFEQELADQCREAGSANTPFVGHPDLVNLLLAIAKRGVCPPAATIKESRLLLIDCQELPTLLDRFLGSDLAFYV